MSSVGLLSLSRHNVALHLTAGKRRSSPENAAAVVGAVLGALVILLSLFIIYLWKKLQAKQCELSLSVLCKQHASSGDFFCNFYWK